MKRNFYSWLFFFAALMSFVDTSASDIQKKALIFGLTGQDGTYLAEFLLSKNYEIHGVIRPSSRSNINKTQGNQSILHFADLTDTGAIFSLIQKIQPDEIYNLAALSHVKISFDIPEYTANVDGLGALRILEALRILGLTKKVKYFQASTSELFGIVKETPQKETTPFYPRSPYGIAKLFAYWMTVNYREAHGIFACNGILFNHESPLRGENFITRKVTLAACRYKLGLQDVLYLGNLDAKRDWGYAKDYVEAMWLMLQQDIPSDYVIATGETHTIRELVELAYNELGIVVEWHDKGIEEYGIDKSTGKKIVKIDPQYFRPIDDDQLVGNNEKALKVLNWKPKTSFNDLIKLMVAEDFKIVEKERGS